LGASTYNQGIPHGGGEGGQYWHGPWAPDGADLGNIEAWKSFRIDASKLFGLGKPRNQIRWMKSLTGQDILPPWVQRFDATVDHVVQGLIEDAVGDGFWGHLLTEVADWLLDLPWVQDIIETFAVPIFDVFDNYQSVNSFVDGHMENNYQNILLHDDGIQFLNHGSTNVQDQYAIAGIPNLPEEWKHGNSNNQMPGNWYTAPWFGSARFGINRDIDFGCESWYKAFFVPWTHGMVGGAYSQANTYYNPTEPSSSSDFVPCPGQSGCGYVRNPHGTYPAGSAFTNPSGFINWIQDSAAWVQSVQQAQVDHTAIPGVAAITCKPNERADLDLVYKHVKHAAKAAQSWFSFPCPPVSFSISGCQPRPQRACGLGPQPYQEAETGFESAFSSGDGPATEAEGIYTKQNITPSLQNLEIEEQYWYSGYDGQSDPFPNTPADPAQIALNNLKKLTQYAKEISTGAYKFEAIKSYVPAKEIDAQQSLKNFQEAVQQKTGTYEND